MRPAQYAPAAGTAKATCAATATLGLVGPRRPHRHSPHHGPRLAACHVVIIERNNEPHRPKPFRLGAGGQSGAAVAAPGSSVQAKSPRRRLRPGGDVAVPCARYGDRRAGAGRFRWRPPQWAGLVGLRPGLLRQVVPKRAVLDAGGSRLYVTKDGSPTSHPASLWRIHATPQPRRRNLRQAFSPVVGVLALPVGRKPVKPSRGDAESATSPFGSGRPVRPGLS